MMQNTATLRREPVFRPAEAGDLNAVLELYTHLHPEEKKPAIDGPIAAVWNQLLTDPRLHCFVVAVGAELVASCVLDIVPNLSRGGRPFGVLQNVVAFPRGQGAGSMLIREALHVAWRNDCYQVLVQTGQPDAIPFYESVGFRPEKVGLVMKPGWEKP